MSAAVTVNNSARPKHPRGRLLFPSFLPFPSLLFQGDRDGGADGLGLPSLFRLNDSVWNDKGSTKGERRPFVERERRPCEHSVWCGGGPMTLRPQERYRLLATREAAQNQAVSVGVCNPSRGGVRPAPWDWAIWQLWLGGIPSHATVIFQADRYQWDSLPSHAYWSDRGEILRSMWDERERRRSAGPHPPIKNESVGIEDDQIPS